jgi:hypothetical protein
MAAQGLALRALLLCVTVAATVLAHEDAHQDHDHGVLARAGREAAAAAAGP